MWDPNVNLSCALGNPQVEGYSRRNVWREDSRTTRPTTTIGDDEWCVFDGPALVGIPEHVRQKDALNTQSVDGLRLQQLPGATSC